LLQAALLPHPGAQYFVFARLEIAMANQDENATPDEPSRRRQPPTIEGKAVEVPLRPAKAPRSSSDMSEAASAAAAEPPQPPPHQADAHPEAAAPRPRSNAALGFGAALVGALVGAGVVAAAGIYFSPEIFKANEDVSGRVATLETQQRNDAARLVAATGDRARIDDLAARLTKVESTPKQAPVPPLDTSLGDRMATLESAIRPLAGRLDELEGQVRDNAAAIRRLGEAGKTEKSGEDTAPVAEARSEIDGLSSRLAVLESAVAALKAAQPDPAQSAQERAAIEALSTRVAVVESLATTLKSAQQVAEKSVQERADKSAAAAALAAERPLRIAMLAAAIRRSVDRSYPFTTELAVARSLGLDPEALAALQPFAEAGVPPANQMLRELSALMPEVGRVAAPESREGGYLERLQAGAERLVRIRPVGAVPSDSPGSPAGQVEVDIARQNIAAAIADLDKLPPAARDLTQAWRQKAVAHVAAVEAARKLADNAFISLGEAADAAPR
jgi:hypothetical protein